MKIHFIGIGGISMSALAKYFLLAKYSVSGSDLCRSDITDSLEKLGANVFIGHRQENIQDAEAVVYNSAINENNIELNKAREKGIFLIQRAELLNFISSQFNSTVAISGSHGKTTATAIIANIFKQSQVKICAHIGGEDISLSNFFYDGNQVFLTEACEYKKNFLLLNPNVAVVLNIDPDHTECYKDKDDLINSFAQFSNKADLAIINGDDESATGIQNALTFGMSKNCYYRAVKVKTKKAKPYFTVLEGGKKLFEISLNIYGRHNVYNALAAVAVARHYNISVDNIIKGINNFKGIKRRFEKMGDLSGAQVICDYAHHPKEIKSQLSIANELFKGKYTVLFQPHTYSRTLNLYDDFLEVLKEAKDLIIYKTYAARENYNYQGSAQRLSLELPNSVFFSDDKRLKEYLLLKLKKGHTLLVLGAGDIYNLFN